MPTLPCLYVCANLHGCPLCAWYCLWLHLLLLGGLVLHFIALIVTATSFPYLRDVQIWNLPNLKQHQRLIVYFVFVIPLLAQHCIIQFCFLENDPTMGVLVKAALLTSLLFSSASAILTITAKGAKLFTSDGKQFYNKGTPPSPIRRTQSHSVARIKHMSYLIKHYSRRSKTSSH